MTEASLSCKRNKKGSLIRLRNEFEMNDDNDGENDSENGIFKHETDLKPSPKKKRKIEENCFSLYHKQSGFTFKKCLINFFCFL